MANYIFMNKYKLAISKYINSMKSISYTLDELNLLLNQLFAHSDTIK